MAKKICYILAVLFFCQSILSPGISAAAAEHENNAFPGRFEETGLPATYEVLTGHETDWWIQHPTSRHYILPKGEASGTFYVRAITDVQMVVELNQEDKNYYITAGTNHDIWSVPGAETGFGSLSAAMAGSRYSFDAGEEYRIEVGRKDRAGGERTDYSIVISDRNTGEIYERFTAANTKMSGSSSVYLMAQVGKFEMYYEGAVIQRHGRDRTRVVPLSAVDNTPEKGYRIPDGLIQKAKDKKYDKYFPKDSIQTVSVQMNENNLDYMLQNAKKKPSVMARSVKIGDARVEYVGIKTKGNYTLSATDSTDSDRFSFTLNFGKYIKKPEYGKKQNFYGCSKISFNNCFFDKTILKEYMSMRLMDEMGVPTPRYSLAKLYINGEYYGVYFMVEAMDHSILERFRGESIKETESFLVKPSYTNLTYRFERELEKCLSGNGEFTEEALEKAGLLVKRDGRYTAQGVLAGYRNLWEEDDDTLQDVAPMLPKALTWNRKIQLLSQGKDFDGKPVDVNGGKYLELLETILDTDGALRYFAAHSFLVQLDNMFTWGQNYGVYINNKGKCTILPWDYDLAWGTVNWGGYNTAEEAANWDIDKMYLDNFSGSFGMYGSMSKKDVYRHMPLFYVIFQNQSLMEKYHAYMEDCARLVSVGGVTSEGKSAEAARFAEIAGALYPQVVQAAAEPVCGHAYYLNGITQPEAAKKGIPALKKLMARRAVGVWLQTQGKKADVTGYGCEIFDIGTGFDKPNKRPTTAGTLTAVDENTGVFATIPYSPGNTGAWIRADVLPEKGEISEVIRRTLKNPVVYRIEIANRKAVTGDYTLYIPVSETYKKAVFYSYSEESKKLRPLKAEPVGGLYSMTGADISYIAVDTPDSPNGAGGNRTDDKLKKGTTFTLGKWKYKVIKASAKGAGEVSLIGAAKKKADKKRTFAAIGGEVKKNGRRFKITEIGNKALFGYKFLKSAVIKKSVKRIGTRAFSGCKRLKKITVKTAALTKKQVGKQAFKGIWAHAVFKVPARKHRAYRKIFRLRGAGRKSIYLS